MAAPEQQRPDTEPAAEQAPLLEATGLRAGYGRRAVLFDVSIAVKPGEIVAIFGHNGAGKTTTLKSVYGLCKPTAGRVRYRDHDVTGAPCSRNVQQGMAYVAAENFVFGELNVLDNLKLGAYLERSRSEVPKRLKRVYEIFPILEERSGQVAGTMSGGQQRMLSIGIALMSGPRLLLIDEPSLGLSPALVQQVMDVIGSLAREEGLSVLLVEQNVTYTLNVVDRAYFMRSGRVILEATAEKLAERESYWELF